MAGWWLGRILVYVRAVANLLPFTSHLSDPVCSTSSFIVVESTLCKNDPTSTIFCPSLFSTFP